MKPDTKLKRKSKVILGQIAALTMFLSFLSCNKPIANRTNNLSASNRVTNLLAKMTLEEKIGQMNQYNGFWDVTGPVPVAGDAKMKYEHLRTGQVGSVLNVAGAAEVRKMQEVVVNESRLGIPLIFGLDVIHGHKTLFPIPLAEAASWDLEAIKQGARISAVEAAARGINWTFAPMVDISRDARWGRVMEGAGEDPYLGSMIAKARVEGFQGESLSDPSTIAATAKHFAAYGFAEGGRDYNTADIGTYTLYNVVLPPFKACLDAGVATFMNGFNVLNGIPATGDRFLQRDLLKGKWGFDGFIVSDWGSINEMVAHGFAADLKEAVVAAANAGCDMDMESLGYVKLLKEAVEEGRVDIAVIDEAVSRILQVKEQLGLFDDPYKYCDVDREELLVGHADHHAAALDVARRSIVLLKNDGQLLPLKKKQQGLAVIGALAADKNSPLGSWRIQSDDETAISVLEGLDKLGVDYTYEQGVRLKNGATDFIREVPINEIDTTGMAAAVGLAKQSEQVIMVLGEVGFQSGEGRSRTRLGFPGLQQELLERVHEVNDNIILVVMSGRPLVLTWADKRIPAILQTWQLGTQSGHAIAETVFGDSNPSGKLPMTFPRAVGQVPIYYNHFKTGRPGPIDLVFWSHYIDESIYPLYPFGHGLSYSKFDYDDLTIDTTMASTRNLGVSVTLENTSDQDGVEIVQLYISDPFASVVRPVKELKGFQKVSLTAGEAQEVRFQLTEKDFSYYNQLGELVFEPGQFVIHVGGSSYCEHQVSVSLN